MEFENEKNTNWFAIGLILAGLAFLYLISKNQQQTQSQQVQSQQYIQEPISRYENAENWEVVRGEDGFISNVKAMRDATVGNSINSNSSIHSPPIRSIHSPIENELDLDKTIKEMIQKNMRDLNELNNRYRRLNDKERSNRFGFT